MKLTISGTPGSGKTTIGKLLAKKLGYEYFDVGGLRRQMAEEKGMTLQEFNELGKIEDWTDKEADKRAETIGKENDNFVFVGRLTYYFVPDAFKVYLKCDLNESAIRIFEEGREKEKYKTIEEAKQQIKKREEEDNKRYEKWYGIQVGNPNDFDLVLDTTNLSIEEVLREIISKLKRVDSFPNEQF